MWIIFASLNPISEAFRSLFIKRTSKEIDPLLISWANNLLPLMVFLPFIFFIDLKFNLKFFGALAGTAAINIVTVILYMKAIKEGEISKVMPMLSFTPLFLLVTSPLITGEFPHTLGMIGVLLVVIGSYMLNLNLKKHDLLYPFKDILKNKGTRYMFAVAFLWSFSANFDKVSIQNSSVIQHIIFMNLVIFSALSIITAARKKFNKERIHLQKKNLFYISLFTTGAFIFHMTALSMTLVAYVVALKRMSGMLSVFIGHFFLKEENIKERLLGSAVMFAGVLFIVLS